jgi:ADP-heptose:LPS heptosyltransferase
VSQHKILIVRFSSIGDIVLTTPIIRCANKQLPDSEIHVVIKESFKETLVNNPYIHKLFTFKKDISELYKKLKDEGYSTIIDLHKNKKSLRLRYHLGVKSYSLNKINVPKFLAVNFKWLNVLPNKHIVERYFEVIEPLGVKNDYFGLDYFIAENEKIDICSVAPTLQTSSFVALVAGGSYYTKQIPLNKLQEICKNIHQPILILGSKTDHGTGESLEKTFSHVKNLCGHLSLNQSASIISQANWVITPDTGLMHIAAAFNRKIISIWGNTIPQFGMVPYLPHEENVILENNHLKCRPCSKLGYKTCPAIHFKCMNDIDVVKATSKVN